MHNLCHGTIYSSFAGGLSHFSFFVDQLFSSPNDTLFQLDYGQITATQLGLILRIKSGFLKIISRPCCKTVSRDCAAAASLLQNIEKFQNDRNRFLRVLFHSISPLVLLEREKTFRWEDRAWGSTRSTTVQVALEFSLLSIMHCSMCPSFFSCTFTLRPCRSQNPANFSQGSIHSLKNVTIFCLSFQHHHHPLFSQWPLSLPPALKWNSAKSLSPATAATAISFGAIWHRRGGGGRRREGWRRRRRKKPLKTSFSGPCSSGKRSS